MALDYQNLHCWLKLGIVIISLGFTGVAKANLVANNINVKVAEVRFQDEGKIQARKSKLIAQDVANAKTALEEGVFAEINRARTNPLAYADWLEEMSRYYFDGWLKFPGQRAVRTNEGFENLDELIEILRNTSPLPAFSPSSELDRAAREILRNNGANDIKSAEILADINARADYFGSNTSYGDTAEVIVMQLIVENGLTENNQSSKILNPDFQLSGVACEAGDSYGNYCYIAYTDQLTERVAKEGEADPANIPNDTPQENGTPQPRENAAAAPLLLEKGILENDDLAMPVDESRYDSYLFEGTAGQTITITLESKDFDTYLAVVDSQNKIIAEHDDINQENSNSLLTVTFLADGVYYIIVNSYEPNGRGEYSLTVR
ncbi:MAG: pre-peptidase C-terminal domain-containing protein [Gomphosphaeria aponina SAG 52.96 = DSM 107014]|uniref:Pre-peptidase C-terminal domain-containing protein n=1 Tax=Gomphosphaeria aponina SAG 52.96 = DSM 107014 TaxID=1521640 RepID=A0A941JQC9_9CHRO|nr:pre-peptidase C-terminal domain-containing protein [Gomphosphaeria aponina SAG 52.96 = DSM 107014]